MSLQLIFVVETRKSCKSDWIYIKDTIDHFYQIDQAHTKISVVYMDSKSTYRSPKTKKKIQEKISQFSPRESRVIYCFDCDDYDSKYEDQKFLGDAKQYCKDKGYDYVWFCKDIEHVYIGERVPDKKKKSVSAGFSVNKRIRNVDTRTLCVDNYRIKSSNIMKVLDTHLNRK